MRNIEILSRLAAKPPGHEIGFKISGDTPELAWEDILLAMQGIPPGRFAFLMYAYADDDHARHGFFAELFMDVMQDLIVHRWILQRKDQGDYHREVEAMCRLAVEEWKWGDCARGGQHSRAEFMGVCRATWRRRYKVIYDYIALRPSEWETEIMKIVTGRLK